MITRGSGSRSLHYSGEPFDQFGKRGLFERVAIFARPDLPFARCRHGELDAVAAPVSAVVCNVRAVRAVIVDHTEDLCRVERRMDQTFRGAFGD